MVVRGATGGGTSKMGEGGEEATGSQLDGSCAWGEHSTVFKLV